LDFFEFLEEVEDCCTGKKPDNSYQNTKGILFIGVIFSKYYKHNNNQSNMIIITKYLEK